MISCHGSNVCVNRAQIVHTKIKELKHTELYLKTERRIATSCLSTSIDYKEILDTAQGELKQYTYSSNT